MLTDLELLNKIVDASVGDLKAKIDLETVVERAIGSYRTRHTGGESVASGYEIRTEFMKALVAKLIKGYKL